MSKPFLFDQKGMTITELMVSSFVGILVLLTVLTAFQKTIELRKKTDDFLGSQEQLDIGVRQIEKFFETTDSIELIDLPIEDLALKPGNTGYLRNFSQTRVMNNNSKIQIARFQTQRNGAFGPTTKTVVLSLIPATIQTPGQLILEPNEILADHVTQFQILNPIVINGTLRSFIIKLSTRIFDPSLPLSQRNYCGTEDIKAGVCQAVNSTDRSKIKTIFLINSEITNVPFANYTSPLGVKLRDPEQL